MATQETLDRLQKAREPREKKKPTFIARVSKKLAAKRKEEAKSGDSKLDLWFEERRKEMTGRCFFCGGTTEKKNDETYRRSIAHLLPKRKNKFPSIATNENNWLELCFFGNSCHTNFDNAQTTFEDIKFHQPKEFEIIVDKFKKIFPFIKEEEKKNIPELLLKELNP